MIRSRGQGRRRFRSVVELSLWVFAACSLGYAGWMAADASIYQLRADREVTALIERASASPARTPVLPPVELGTPIGRLSIPALELSVVVAEGIDDGVLRRAVGRVPSSALPGETGNLVLAGHRDTFLRELENVRAGELVVVESAAGRHVYEVEWTEIVEPEAVEMMDPTDYPALTIVTCYPFRYIGPAPQRFVVRARRVLDERREPVLSPPPAGVRIGG
jgi:sortase A